MSTRDRNIWILIVFILSGLVIEYSSGSLNEFFIIDMLGIMNADTQTTKTNIFATFIYFSSILFPFSSNLSFGSRSNNIRIGA